MTGFVWTTEAVAAVLAVTPVGEARNRFGRISTDTRDTQQGDLFVALVGERFDAHGFLGQAARAGAAGAVVSRIPKDAPADLQYFLVPDTRAALGALAGHFRRRLAARVVGVVGSNGKTTTKDLIHAALGTTFRVHATRGNFNNQIGVPLTLLAAPPDSEMLVVEMGTNEPGEIRILANIVHPDAVVVTSIGEEHLEKLGDLRGVLEEELSVLESATRPALAIVADEPEALPIRARELMPRENVLVAGFSTAADLHPEGGADGITVLPDGRTRWRWDGHEVNLRLPGRFNVRNALLALGLAREWGVPDADAVRGIESVGSAKLRGEWYRIGGLNVLADCYNSNPPSARAAIELLANVPAEGRKVAVLGTMRELGDAAPALHRSTAAAAAALVGCGIDLLVATGDFANAFDSAAPGPDGALITCSDPLAAYDLLAPRLVGNETMLLKASRGESLERWLPLLERDFSPERTDS